MRYALPERGEVLGHFTFSYSPVRDAAGTVTGIAAIAVEVTEFVMARNQRSSGSGARSGGCWRSPTQRSC